MDFFDRRCSLQLGDYQSGDGILITELRIKFRVRKSVDNKSKIDKCYVEVDNLSEKNIAYLTTPYPVAILSCGYGDQLVRLFYGEVTGVETRNQGTDRTTKIEILPAFSDLTFQILSEVIPENGVIQDAIEVIRKSTDISKGVYKGNNINTKVIYGLSLSGTPKEMLDSVCSSYGLFWRVDDNTLYINDSDSLESESKELAPVVSVTSGLIDRPYYFSGVEKKSGKNKTKKVGVKFTALLNPNILPGSLVRVDFKGESDYYRVEEATYSGDTRGGDWYVDCLCSAIKE